MPDVNIARPTGFCFGVERAIRLARQGLKKYGQVWTYGELVHNPEVLRELRKDGIRPVLRLQGLKDGALVIRAHGCPQRTFDECSRLGIAVIDATCPYVRRVQNVVRSLSDEGYRVVVVGEKNHPEVKAILSAAGRRAQVLSPENRGGTNPIRLKTQRGKIGVVAQTTIDKESFKAVVARLLNFGYNELRVFDTICAEVTARQRSTVQLAKTVDAVIVVGGKNSANTTRLAQLVRACGRPVLHIAEPAELKPETWQRFKRVGIVAGASTPAEAVKEIARILRNTGCVFRKC
ncbi:MAG: 4-hydroxy-3-methylbut-2-enyl diphosphate reductase [bacterium]